VVEINNTTTSSTEPLLNKTREIEELELNEVVVQDPNPKL